MAVTTRMAIGTTPAFAPQCLRTGAAKPPSALLQLNSAANSQAFRVRPFQAINTGRRPQIRKISCAAQPLKVAVTGAGGRTGSLTVERLLAEPEKYSVLAIVRSDKSASKLTGAGVPDGAITVIDVAADGAEAALERAFGGVDSLVIATSAVPQIKKLSLVPFLFKKYVLRQEGARPQFGWTADQPPERVDWIGQKAQIDAAKKAGVKQIVLVSSMGGTNEKNPLNDLGNGKILVWKRKAEEYLVASGVPYTIIHPGGLIDDKGVGQGPVLGMEDILIRQGHLQHDWKDGGEREVVLNVDDKLIQKAEKEGTSRSIPREDVAALAVSALTASAAKNRSIDCVAKKPGDGTVTTDFDALWASATGDCKY